jgi:hypothetical protein
VEARILRNGHHSQNKLISIRDIRRTDSVHPGFQVMNMPTFFKPLRRKIGLVTLVLACVLTSAWLRSCYRLDLISLNSLCPRVTFVSGGGRFQIVDGQFASMIAVHGSSAIDIVERKITFARVDLNRWPMHRWIWPSLQGWPITKFEIQTSSGTNETVVNMLPYWPIVIPLTLLSAWMLLSKPKPCNPSTTIPVQS